MKTNYILSLLIVFLLFIYSCKKELVPQESSGISIPATTENALNPAQNLPITQQNTNANTLVAMNPAHGQVGHRCDIAVGAPLNSSPNKTVSTSAPSVMNSAPNSKTTTAVTNPGMNPPHGQAGHRCDIAVGAPLNSAPKSAKSTPATSVKNSVSNSQTPAILNPNTTPVVTKPGMNPPHGQEGHRCDIAVGAPLNSASTKAISTPTPATTNAEPNSPVPAILNPDTTATAPKP